MYFSSISISCTGWCSDIASSTYELLTIEARIAKPDFFRFDNNSFTFPQRKTAMILDEIVLRISIDGYG